LRSRVPTTIQGGAPVPLQDSLNKLQLLIIELEYAVADVVYEANNLQQSSDDDLWFLQQHAYLVNISAQNLVISARAALSRDLEKKSFSLA
jgi:hypothetical protein